MKVKDVLALPWGFFALNVIVTSIGGYFLWNWLMPDLFELPKIGFFQIVGLILLVKCFIVRGIVTINSINLNGYAAI